MDIIILLKTLAIGCLGAGGFYFLMSFAFQYFPMPLFLKSRDIFLTWASKKHKKKGDFWDKIWNIGRVFFIVMMLLTWWGMFGMYAYCLYLGLHYYFDFAENAFWTHYAIAIALPCLWALVKFFGFFRSKSEKPPVELEDDSNKTLLERMASS